MPNPVLRGFANLHRFSGRDTRAQFWPYAAAAFGLYLVVGWAVATPILLPVFGETGSEAQFLAIATRFISASLVMGGVLLALLAAAVARRLHDGGHTAFWGLLPLPFAAYSGATLLGVVSTFATETPDARLLVSMFASNALYLAGVVTLIVFLILPGTPGPNRHGEPGP